MLLSHLPLVCDKQVCGDLAHILFLPMSIPSIYEDHNRSPIGSTLAIRNYIYQVALHPHVPLEMSTSVRYMQSTQGTLLGCCVSFLAYWHEKLLFLALVYKYRIL